MTDRPVEVDTIHRDGRGQSDRPDARKLSQTFGNLLVRSCGLLDAADERLGDGHAERLDLFGTREAGIDLTQGDERSDHQARNHQEHERQRRLRYDERIARPVPFRTFAACSAAFFQRRQARHTELENGSQTEEQPRAYCAREREQQDDGVEGYFFDAW
jgi:hypothetical protein